MGRYETFVIRLWMEGSAEMAHGEIRHLPVGAAHRFRRLNEMLAFIERESAHAGSNERNMPGSRLFVVEPVGELADGESP